MRRRSTPVMAFAENAEFSEICARSGITFIGPTPEQIRLMGDKATARETMVKTGVPTVLALMESCRPWRRRFNCEEMVSRHDQGVGGWWWEGYEGFNGCR